jgi:hypothetical protein
MKKIRIKICQLNPNYDNAKTHFIYKALRKYYDIEISENPEYVFFQESSHEYLDYNGIKIFYTGENVSPNFNLCDYAVGCDYMSYGDRYYRLPLYLIISYCDEGELGIGITNGLAKTEPFTQEDLLKKTEFCSFVYSNYLGDGARASFFNKLNSYKKVNAGGRFMNNVGGFVPDKLKFETKHKFSIAFENSSRAGYTTEKIINAFSAKAIPIYWGNPEIGREFNEKSFINCHSYKTFDQVVDRIKEIDENDALYLSIINEPVAVPGYNFEEVVSGFEAFLQKIIEQPLSSAKRKTINPSHARILENNEKVASKYLSINNKVVKILATIYKPFKKIAFIEKFKEKMFIKRL